MTWAVVGALLPSGGAWIAGSAVLICLSIGFTTTVADVGLHRTVQALLPRGLRQHG
jgi:hypothetical protein